MIILERVSCADEWRNALSSFDIANIDSMASLSSDAMLSAVVNSKSTDTDDPLDYDLCYIRVFVTYDSS